MCKIECYCSNRYISYIYFSLTCVVFDGIIIFLGSKGLVSKPLNAVDRKLNNAKMVSIWKEVQNWFCVIFILWFLLSTRYPIFNITRAAPFSTKAITRNKLTPSYLLRLDLTCCDRCRSQLLLVVVVVVTYERCSGEENGSGNLICMKPRMSAACWRYL